LSHHLGTRHELLLKGLTEELNLVVLLDWISEKFELVEGILEA
jgi:hypothetical protein